jgi:hypothetical protein
MAWEMYVGIALLVLSAVIYIGLELSKRFWEE